MELQNERVVAVITVGDHDNAPLFRYAGDIRVQGSVTACTQVSNLVKIFVIGFYEESDYVSHVLSRLRKLRVPVRYVKTNKSKQYGSDGGFYDIRDTIMEEKPSHIFLLDCKFSFNFPLQEMLDSHKRYGGVGAVLPSEVNNLRKWSACVFTPDIFILIRRLHIEYEDTFHRTEDFTIFDHVNAIRCFTAGFLMVQLKSTHITLKKQLYTYEGDGILKPYQTFPIYPLNDRSVERDSSSRGERAETSASEGGEPHDAFEFVLPYLRVKELLVVETVCRSLHEAIRTDRSLWKTMHIDFSLSQRVTNYYLLKLARRAQGNLQCLRLECCDLVSDYGVMLVLLIHPTLRKLSVTGCMGLSGVGMMRNFRVLKASSLLELKSFETEGTIEFTKRQFKDMKVLLGEDAKAKSDQKPKKPRFFGAKRSLVYSKDEEVTDLEICPRCEKPNVVYDCPRQECREREDTSPLSCCRACIFCIERCFRCGCCCPLAFNCPVCS